MGWKTQTTDGKKSAEKCFQVTDCASTHLPLRTIIDHSCVDSGDQISDTRFWVKYVYTSRVAT